MDQRVQYTAFLDAVEEQHAAQEEAERQRRNSLPYVPQKPSGGGQKTNSGKKTNSSGPSVSDFVHPDDFYDWYRDGFADFEEAEDYYYSHGGR